MNDEKLNNDLMKQKEEEVYKMLQEEKQYEIDSFNKKSEEVADMLSNPTLYLIKKYHLSFRVMAMCLVSFILFYFNTK